MFILGRPRGAGRLLQTVQVQLALIASAAPFPSTRGALSEFPRLSAGATGKGAALGTVGRACA